MLYEYCPLAAPLLRGASHDEGIGAYLYAHHKQDVDCFQIALSCQR